MVSESQGFKMVRISPSASFSMDFYSSNLLVIQVFQDEQLDPSLFRQRS